MNFSDLNKRLDHLKGLLKAELELPNPASRYVEDLKASIEYCEKQLKWRKANPGGYQVINGRNSA